MRKFLICFILSFSFLQLNSQTCQEMIDYVKSNSYGSTYYSPTSSAISQVSFYNVRIDYSTYYFAIVCFKDNYYGCNEYIYQVGSNTQIQYSMNYLDSAGKAFWRYIQPYNDNLGCAPNFN